MQQAPRHIKIDSSISGCALEKIGDAPKRIVQNIRAAAAADQQAYLAVNGKETKPLTCPLALDASVAWGAANPQLVPPITVSEGQISRMVKACYNPELDGNVTIGETGETMSVQRMGKVVGEWLGRQYRIEADIVGATRTQLDGSTATPTNVPLPQPAPERPSKQARAVGN